MGLIHYSGAEFIWRKFIPEKKDKLPTGWIWLTGIYLALFGIASQRYQSIVDSLEYRHTSFLTTVGAGAPFIGSKLTAIERSNCPIKPEFTSPWSVITSIIFLQNHYPPFENLLKVTVQDWKNKLNNANLLGADLSNMNLEGANLRRAELQNANLSGANLDSANISQASMIGTNLNRAKLSLANLTQSYLILANLRNADLRDVDLTLANLSDANLSGAYLKRANFKCAILKGANLTGANLSEAKLENAEISMEQLKSAKTLVGITGLHREVLEKLKAENPNLFKK